MADELVPAPQTAPAVQDAEVDTRKLFGHELPVQAGGIVHEGIALAQLTKEEAKALTKRKQQMRRDFRKTRTAAPIYAHMVRDITVAKIKGDALKPTFSRNFGVLLIGSVQSDVDWTKAAQEMLEKDRSDRGPTPIDVESTPVVPDEKP